MRHEPDIVAQGEDQGVRGPVCSFWGSEGESVSLARPASEGRLRSWARGLRLRPQSQQRGPRLPRGVAGLPSAENCPLPPPGPPPLRLRPPWDSLGPVGWIRDHLPISSAAAQSYLQSPFRQARSLWRVPEMRTRTSFGSRALFGRPQAPRSTRRAPRVSSPPPPPWKPPRGSPDRRLCICTPFRPFTQTPLRLFRPDAPNTA